MSTITEILRQARQGYLLSSGSIFNPEDAVCVNVEREAEQRLKAYFLGLLVDEEPFPHMEGYTDLDFQKPKIRNQLRKELRERINE
jgi:hypothetical protein